MPDSTDSSRQPMSAELAELVQRTHASKRAHGRAERIAPGPSWSVSIRFRIGGFRPRPGWRR